MINTLHEVNWTKKRNGSDSKVGDIWWKKKTSDFNQNFSGLLQLNVSVIHSIQSFMVDCSSMLAVRARARRGTSDWCRTELTLQYCPMLKAMWENLMHLTCITNSDLQILEMKISEQSVMSTESQWIQIFCSVRHHYKIQSFIAQRMVIN